MPRCNTCDYCARKRRREIESMGDRLTRLELAVDFIQRAIVELRADLRAVKADVDDIRTREFNGPFGATFTKGRGLAGLM